MSRPVRFSPEAVDDLARIHDHIAMQAGERIAAAYIGRIYQHCLGLGTFPERGTRRDDIWPGLRLAGFERRVTIAIEVTDVEIRIIRLFGRGQDVEGGFET